MYFFFTLGGSLTFCYTQKKIVECDSALRDAPRCVVFTFERRKSWPRATHTDTVERERKKGENT